MRCSGAELVATRCDPAALFNFLEGAFDEITSPVKIRTEADWLVAIFSAGNLPTPLPDGEFSDPIAEAPSGSSVTSTTVEAAERLQSRCRVQHVRARQSSIATTQPADIAKKTRDKHFAYRGVHGPHFSLASLASQHITWTLRSSGVAHRQESMGRLARNAYCKRWALAGRWSIAASSCILKDLARRKSPSSPADVVLA